jgi:hypothetical protein
MDKKANFEKRIVDLVEGSYKNFAKSKAIAGSLTGGGIGGLLGVGDTAMKHMRGDLGEMSGGDIAGLYASKALTGAGMGAGAGALLGGSRGRNIKNNLVKAEREKMLQALAPYKGSARRLASQDLFDSMALSGKFNDVHAIDYLKNSDSFLNNSAAKILEGVGMKAPAKQVGNADDIVKGVSKFLETGDEAFLASSGLTGVEMEALKRRASGAMGTPGGYGSAAENLRKEFEGDVSSLIASKGATPPSSYSSFPLTAPKPLDLNALVAESNANLTDLTSKLVANPTDAKLVTELKAARERNSDLKAAKVHYDDYMRYTGAGAFVFADRAFERWMNLMAKISAL